MSSYLIGNLVGRLLMSTLLVWLVLLCTNRFDTGKSTKKLLRPVALLSTFTLFFLGLAGHAVAGTSNKLQIYAVPDIGLPETSISAVSEWPLEAEQLNQYKSPGLNFQNPKNIETLILSIRPAPPSMASLR